MVTDGEAEGGDGRWGVVSEGYVLVVGRGVEVVRRLSAVNAVDVVEGSVGDPYRGGEVDARTKRVVRPFVAGKRDVVVGSALGRCLEPTE
ncbi:hypothetical protein VTJ04DRAFT_1425 [Mycothermus thermophilus]|uniref:uncharacterized protein n=1 Tax=Humicola insolens TaxID=85995 RepID=UPI0037446B08